MNSQRITTTVTYEQWKLAMDKGWKWSELIKKGIGAMLEPTVLQEKLAKAEQDLDAYKQADKLRSMRGQRRNWFGQ